MSIFITGATGYLGGTTLTLLLKTLPSATYTALVRTPAQADAITAAHPTVTPIIGDISSPEIVTAAAKAADVVVDIAGDNEAGLRSILSGLADRPEKEGEGKGTLIHVSGITCLLDPLNLKLGYPAEKVYSDVQDMTEILGFGPEREHAALDQAVFRIGEETGVRTVILSSCQIMGNGDGAWKRESFGHGYVKTVLGRGKGFVVEKGGNRWSWCSVHDVAAAIVFILQKVLDRSSSSSSSSSSSLGYGRDGYYFVQTGEVSFREQAQAVASKLQELGKLDSDDIDELTVAQATEIHPYAGLLWGASCRSRADRLRALGWTPAQTDWRLLMEETVLASI